MAALRRVVPWVNLSEDWVRGPLPHCRRTNGKSGCGQGSEPYGKVDTAQVGSRFTWCEILGDLRTELRT